MTMPGYIQKEIAVQPRRQDLNAAHPNSHKLDQKKPPKPAQKGPKAKRDRRPNYNDIHRNPLPVELAPLPVLIPHNPLSIIAIALTYLAQLLLTPSQTPCDGYFSPNTSSIHVTDAQTARRLWEMGFFGKGSL